MAQRSPVGPLMRSQTIGPTLRYVRERGGDPAALIGALALPVTAEDDAEVTVPLATVHAFYEAAARAASDPFLGVGLALRWERGAFGLLEFCCRSAPTVGDALSRLVRYAALSNELVRITMERRHDSVVIEHRIPGEPRCVGRHGNEFLVTLVLLCVRALTGTACRPRRVWFAHPAPGDTTTLAKVLDAEPTFGLGSNGLVLDATLLDATLVSADPALSTVLDRQAEQLLAQAPSPADLPGQVRRAVRDGLNRGAPDVRTIARTLGTSPRSLQRRLQEEGTSFQALVDSVRRDLAEAYVADPAIPLGEVAFRLGYADTSAFLKAFKRWTGSTPRRFRSA